MKKYLLILFTFISLLAYSQASFENGFIDKEGQLQKTDISFITSSFEWMVSEDLTTVYCQVFERDSLVETLLWHIDKIYLNDTSYYTYDVSSQDGRKFLLEFKKDSNLVLILNQETLQYTAMLGEGVHYE